MKTFANMPDFTEALIRTGLNDLERPWTIHERVSASNMNWYELEIG
jgi:hypothetical protein